VELSVNQFDFSVDGLPESFRTTLATRHKDDIFSFSLGGRVAGYDETPDIAIPSRKEHFDDHARKCLKVHIRRSLCSYREAFFIVENLVRTPRARKLAGSVNFWLITFAKHWNRHLAFPN